MILTVPSFPLLGEPGDWDVLTLVAATIFLESEGEPEDGIVGVAWVIRRRALDWKQGWHGAILGPDLSAYADARPFETISAWNNDYMVRAKARLASVVDATPFWRAAAGVLWDLIPDPVGGASFYLNPEITLKIRKGTFPSWAADPANPKKLNEAKVTATIGRHLFLRG